MKSFDEMLLDDMIDEDHFENLLDDFDCIDAFCHLDDEGEICKGLFDDDDEDEFEDEDIDIIDDMIDND